MTERKWTLPEYIFYRDIKVKDMADKINVQPSYLSSILNGRNPCSRKMAKAIEKETGGMIKAAEIEGTYIRKVAHG